MSDLLDERLELGDQVVERGDVLVALDAQPVELVGELGLLALQRGDAVVQRALAGLRRGGGLAGRRGLSAGGRAPPRAGLRAG